MDETKKVNFLAFLANQDSDAPTKFKDLLWEESFRGKKSQLSF